MVLGLATNLDSVVFLSLKRGREGGRERKERRKEGEEEGERERGREGKKDTLVECYNSKINNDTSIWAVVRKYMYMHMAGDGKCPPPPFFVFLTKLCICCHTLKAERPLIGV